VSELAIETSDLAKQFGGVHAVDHVSLSIPANQVRGVIGPNGAGKTTLINVLSGVDRASSGRYRLFSTDATRWSLRRIVHEAGVVRTFQTVRLFESMSVLDNVSVAAGATLSTRRWVPSRGAHRAATARAQEMVDRLGLTDVADAPVTELAYGIRRTVEIARALITEPRVLLLDEPAAGLNTAERERLADLLRELRDGGLTIVLVEHQMDLVAAVCDQLTVLDFGKIICEGPPAEVVADQRVLDAYLGGGGAIDD
jgi:branched-chain amino acid transport system ATP-binding protein